MRRRGVQEYTRQLRGFSIPELTVILVILLLFLGLAQQLVSNSTGAAELESAAQELVTEIGAARVQSLAESASMRLVLDSRQATYQRQRNVEGFWIAESDARPLPRSLTVVSSDAVVFLPTGIPETGAMIQLKNQKEELASIRVSRGGGVRLEYGTLP